MLSPALPLRSPTNRTAGEIGVVPTPLVMSRRSTIEVSKMHTSSGIPPSSPSCPPTVREAKGVSRYGLGIASVLFLILAVGTCLQIRSCTGNTEVSEVPGIYVGENDCRKEKITIRPDGTFTQVVTLQSTGKTSQTSGEWELGRREYPFGQNLCFQDHFLMFTDSCDEFLPKLESDSYVTSMPVGRDFGWLGPLSFGTAEGIIYSKPGFPI